MLILDGYGLEGFVLGTVATPLAILAGGDGQLMDNPTFLVHRKQDKFLASWLLSTVIDEILVHLTAAKTSFEVWTAIEKRFGTTSSIKAASLRHALYSIKKSSLTVKEYLAKVNNLSDSLTAVGSLVTEREQVSVILLGLPMEYESVRVFASATPISLDLLTDMLLDCEARHLALLTETLLQANLVDKYQGTFGGSKSTYLQASKQGCSSSNRGWSRGRTRGAGWGWSRSRPQCQLCGKFGHIVQNCYHRFDENFSGQSPSVNLHHTQDFAHSSASCSSMVSCSGSCSCSQSSPSSTSTDQTWYPDSGATNHVTPDRSNLMTAAPYTGTGRVLMGNGKSIPIANVGSSSVLAGSRLLHLQNVLHVPIVCKNLISVGQFAKDNAVYFEFHHYLCFVKDIQTEDSSPGPHV